MGKSFSSAVSIATAEPSSLLNETLTPNFHFPSPEALNAGKYSKAANLTKTCPGHILAQMEENQIIFKAIKIKAFFYDY